MIDPTAAAYALLLGAVAAFNPCGFALLPAYVTVIVTGTADERVGRAVAMRRAIGFGAAMTLAFTAVFLVFGLLFGAVNAGLQGSILPYVSYVTVAIGAALIVLGAVVAWKGELRGPGLSMRGSAPGRSFASQLAYGAAFAVASLSCTIGLFLGVVAQSLAAPGVVAAVVPFVAYGVGMGASILTVSMLAALAGAQAAATLRSRTPLLMRIGGVLMIAAGLYVLVFGLAEVLPHFGIRALDPVLLTTAQWQSTVSAWIASWGTTLLVAAVIAVAVAVVVVLVAARRQERASVPVAAGGADAHEGSAASSDDRVVTADPTTLSAIRDAIGRAER